MSQSLDARPRPRGRPAVPGLRERILRAAESAFLRRDFHEVRMEDLARASGVGKGTLYRYFAGKDDLFAALVLDGMDRLRHELEAAASAASEPVLKLEGVVRASLEHLSERRFLLALLYRAEHKPSRDEAREWERRRVRLLRVVEDAVGEAVDAGQIRDVEPAVAAEALFALLRAVDRRRRPGDSLDALVASVFDLFLRGAGTPAGQRVWKPRGARS